MKKLKLLGVLTACVLSVSSLTCCREKSEKISFSAPFAETADGEKITVPMGGYEIEAGSIPDEYAERICGVFKEDVNVENLNSVCFGENIFGVGLAAVVYFGKYADNLEADEWEQLCVIAEDYEKNRKLPDDPPNKMTDFVSRIPDSAYFDAMIEEIVADYCEENECSRREAINFLYSGGITIKTPYRKDIQSVLDTVYAENSNFSDDTEHRFPQSACAVLDYNGGVIAITGGNNGNSAYNRCGRIPHKPGSSIKPLSIYAPAIDKKTIHFSSLIPDEPLIYEDENGSYEWPKNHDGVYDGNITVTCALRKSKNAAAAQLAQLLTPEYCCDFLKERFCLTTVTERDCSNAAMALGAFERGVYLHELAAAYAVFGNSGMYYEPHFYTELLDSEGNTVLKNEIKTHQVIDSANAWIMNRLLYYNVNMPDGIAGGAALENVEVIGKTGTASNDSNFDSGRIFVGAVPDYAAAVWIGYDNEDSMEDSQYTPPDRLWKTIIGQLPIENSEFESDDNVVECDYCTSSGGIVSAGCCESETGFYTKDNLPYVCTEH